MKQTRRSTKQMVWPKTRTTRYRDESVEVLYYSMTIDMDLLHRLACKAADNKSGKSKMGPVEVVITEAGTFKDGREVVENRSVADNKNCQHEYSYAVFPAGKCIKCGVHD